MSEQGKTVRLGVVGMGSRGGMFAAVAGAAANAELVGVCEIDQARLKQVSGALGVPGFADTEGLCRETSPDAVVIATPDFAHREGAVAAAEAGCHLMIEKPLAMTGEDARAIADAVGAAGVQAMVAFENHWSPVAAGMKAAADAGELGELICCTSQLDDRIDVPTKWIPWLKHSGPGWFLAAHAVELATWVSGQKPTRVWAQGHKGVLAKLGAGTWDALHAVINFDGGMVGSFTSNFVQPKSLPLAYQFRQEYVGTAGAVRLDATDQALHKATDVYEHPSTIGVPVAGGAPVTSPPAQMLIAFLDAVAAGEPVPCPIEDGLLNVAVLTAIHESAERGEVMEVRV
ncbi:MAG: Gfo/Idh/MocA family protein [Planctomycetota bacterium]|jgi:predicted dehydrogenase